MHKLTTPIVTLIAAFLLAGCANQLRPPLAPQAAYVESLKNRYARVASDDQTTLSASTAKERNKIMNELIFLVNDYYDRYELRWYSTTSGVTAFSDIATMGLDLGAAVAGGNSLKTVLSTISAGVGGTKLALQNDVLQSQNIVLIIRTMRETRRAKYEFIRAKMMDSIDVYPLEEGLIDIQEYWHSGTVIGALQRLHNQTSFEAALKAETDVQTERVRQVNALREALDSERKAARGRGTSAARGQRPEPRPVVVNPPPGPVPSPGPVVVDPPVPVENPVQPAPVAMSDQEIRKAAIQRVALLPAGKAAEILRTVGGNPGSDDTSSRERLKIRISETSGETLRALDKLIP